MGQSEQRGQLLIEQLASNKIEWEDFLVGIDK